MAYDNTKLIRAIAEWVALECTEGFGETYSGDLLKSFEEYCERTGSMKRSPGRVVFGRMLAERKYEKRRLCGLTYWSGILLNKPEGVSAPRENEKSSDTLRVKEIQDRREKQKSAEEIKAAERERRAAEVMERMAAENKAKIREAGVKQG